MSLSSVSPQARDLFDRVRMGYMVFASKHTNEWRRLLGDGLGMDVTEHAGHLVCRMDQQECRILVAPDAGEDIQALGLELVDSEALTEVLGRLRSRSIPVQEVTGERALLRGVSSFWQFNGPKNLQIELYTQPLLSSVSPRLKVSGFMTGDMGFGHMAIVTQRPEDMLNFWQQIFDIRYSDDVIQRISGVKLHFQFLRFNRRHHSIALGSTYGLRLNPFRTRIQHAEVQVATLEDLTRTYERCRALGLIITMEVGQHANDHAVSFYVQTPCGFDFECGWNPLSVEESKWKQEVWDRISIWGHKPVGVTLVDRLGQLGHALATVATSEFIPPTR